MNENVQYVKSINGYPIKDETARTEIANIDTDIDAKIQVSEQGILATVSQTYETQSGTDAKIQSAITQSASDILSTVSSTYATESELTTQVSTINQRADNIESTVATKVGASEIISKINQSAEQVSISANKIDLTGKNLNLTSDNMTISSTNFSVDASGNLTANNATLNGATLDGGAIHLTDRGNANIDIGQNYNGVQITDDNTNPNKMELTTYNLKFTNTTGSRETEFTNDGITIKGLNEVYPGISIGLNSTGGTVNGQMLLYGDNSTTPKIRLEGNGGYIECTQLNQTSKSEYKKNFEKLDNALDIIKATDIYKYNLKEENDTDKKHIGIVIGDNFNYSKEITSKNNEGVDLYSFISVCCKAIQELQKEIEELKANK